jgi:hypothetical protein
MMVLKMHQLLSFFCAHYSLHDLSCVFFLHDSQTGPKMSYSKRPQTLTYGSSQATSILIPCRNELLDYFSCSHDLFLYFCFMSQNSFFYLCSNVGLHLLYTLSHFLLQCAFHSCKFLYYPKCFLL